MKQLSIFIGLSLSLTASAFACTCMPPPPDLQTRLTVAEWQINRAAVVFEGKVESTELQGWPLRPETGQTVSMIPRMRVTFSNVRLYRSAAQTEFIVETGLGGGDCGYRFQPGKSYLVYAWKGDSGNLSTSICSATTLLDYAGTALRLLRGDAPTPRDLADRRSDDAISSPSMPILDRKLCGRLSFPAGRKARSLTLYFWPAEPDAVPLPVDNVDSEEDGSFCVTGLDPGKYLVEAVESPSGTAKFQYTGFFPGVKSRAQAQPVLITTEGALRGYLRGVPEADNDDFKVMIMGSLTDVLHVVEPAPLGSPRLLRDPWRTAGKVLPLRFAGWRRKRNHDVCERDRRSGSSRRLRRSQAAICCRQIAGRCSLPVADAHCSSHRPTARGPSSSRPFPKAWRTSLTATFGWNPQNGIV